jgi:hypothetical protein
MIYVEEFIYDLKLITFFVKSVDIAKKHNNQPT